MAASTLGYPCLRQVPDETVVRRYMDFAQLASLLQTRRLCFSRIDRYTDDWAEGEYPDTDLAAYREEYGKADSSGAPARPYDGMARDWTFASCWCMEDAESYLLWRVYGYKQGVAVRSQYGRLRRELPDNCHLGCITYIDRASASLGFSDSLAPAMNKRKEFESEKEVRAVMLWHQEHITATLEQRRERRAGKDVAVSLPSPPPPHLLTDPLVLLRIVDAVVVSPFADDWFFSAVQSLVGSLYKEMRVERSAMGRA